MTRFIVLQLWKEDVQNGSYWGNLKSWKVLYSFGRFKERSGAREMAQPLEAKLRTRERERESVSLSYSFWRLLAFLHVFQPAHLSLVSVTKPLSSFSSSLSLIKTLVVILDLL